MATPEKGIEEEEVAWWHVQEAFYLHSSLDEVQSDSQGFPHEDVWVVGVLKGLLKLLQLPAAVVGPRTPLLHWPLFIWRRIMGAPITQSPTGKRQLMVQN